MHFYVPFKFFKVPFDFSAVLKAAFCKAKVDRGTPERAKMSFLFFFNQMAFFMYFYMLFHIFQLPFDFPFLPKPAFCKGKVHRDTPKGGKMSVPFFSNRMAFFRYFYVLFHFLKLPVVFFDFQKQHFARIKGIGVPRKEEECKLFFL